MYRHCIDYGIFDLSNKMQMYAHLRFSNELCVKTCVKYTYTILYVHPFLFYLCVFTKYCIFYSFYYFNHIWYLGKCLEVNASDGTITAQSCKDFSSGCPQKPFFNNDFYKCKDMLPNYNWIFFINLCFIFYLLFLKDVYYSHRKIQIIIK